MKLSRPSPDSIRPRPARGVEVVSGFKDEEEDGIEFDPKRDISKKDWERMKETLEECRGTNWWSFSNTATNLSILFPDRKAELNLNDEVFEGIKEKLEELRGTNWEGFSGIAMNLSLIAAERAEILNGQIIITPKLPKLTSEPKPLPERLRIS